MILFLLPLSLDFCFTHPVLQRCWLGDRKGIQPAQDPAPAISEGSHCVVPYPA